MTLWQLKRISTGEALSNPQTLPENWGPIFGLENFKDRLGDLSWVSIPDQGWFEVDQDTMIDTTTSEELLQSMENRINDIIKEADGMIASPTSKGHIGDWIEYKKSLQEICMQGGYPTDITWPPKPE